MLRFAILIAAGVETLLWVYLAGAGVADTLAFSKGHGGQVAVLTTALFVTLVLPALALATCNWEYRPCRPPHRCRRIA